MKKFEIAGNGWYTIPGTNTRKPCQFLKTQTIAFYHDDYHSGRSWESIGTIENLIWTLKNDIHPFTHNLSKAIQQLKIILRQDLPEIFRQTNSRELTVCVIPRAKVESHYRLDQLHFKATICEVANELENFLDGTSYITRKTNTRTTHLDRSGAGGDGQTPYPGITKDTCIISNEITGKDLLVIDDVYTKDVGIDEDAIQALLDSGAHSVIFYSIGKTLK